MAQQRPPRVTGPGHDTFWEGCAQGELRIQKCGKCGHRPWPVVQSCEQCGSDALAFEAVSGKKNESSSTNTGRPSAICSES